MKLDDNDFKTFVWEFTVKGNVKSFISIIDSMLCTFYYNQTPVNFITSDSPVCIAQVINGVLGLGMAGIGNKDCVILYPITPRITVALSHRNSFFRNNLEMFENRKCPVRDPNDVNNFNQRQFLQCNKQIYSRDKIDKNAYLIEPA